MQMSYFKAKMPQIRFRLGLSLLGELTAIPRSSSCDLRGPTAKGTEGTGKVGNGKNSGKGSGIKGGEGMEREAEERDEVQG